MIFPCEKAVWYHLPQIRADLAIELVRTGMTQSQAAKKLGVTPAAVSQYIHKKRGMQLPKTRHYRQEIKAAVKKIREDDSPKELLFIVCKCCQLLQKEGEDIACAASEGKS
ncbi:MAG: helix-turn-helix domain-containing protein [Chlorobiaceae bacterium]|nr:helix-turn-helix domain-containing protein [Chlorobiaceae bacterium]NTW62750.1 helix-turn-helix domain-containing protein [Chlorobiaceae bacterium]